MIKPKPLSKSGQQLVVKPCILSNHLTDRPHQFAVFKFTHIHTKSTFKTHKLVHVRMHFLYDRVDCRQFLYIRTQFFRLVQEIWTKYICCNDAQILAVIAPNIQLIIGDIVIRPVLNVFSPVEKCVCPKRYPVPRRS